MLSADCADLAWLEAGWPVIRRGGFGLHAFVTGQRGNDWNRIIALAEEGVSFGSMLMSGTPAGGLNNDELLEEAVQSKATLEHVLATPVTTVSASIRISDTRIEQILAGAGYERAFRTVGSRAWITFDRMQTPRIVIDPDCSIDNFAAALGEPIEAPEPADQPI